MHQIHHYNTMQEATIMSQLSPSITTLLPPKPSRTTTHFISHRFHNKAFVCSSSRRETPVQRRTVALGLASLVLGLEVSGGARAAARRPPPPPPQEKQDPNVSGVLAKVLASKKRKEAMKENIAKLRERGKPINGAKKEEPIQQPSE